MTEGGIGMEKWRINILCIIGAIVGFAAMFLPLVNYYSLQNDSTWAYTNSVPMILLLGPAFLIGLIVSLFTPLGGIIQFIMMWVAAGPLTTYTGIPEVHQEDAIGIGIVWLSIFLILTSLIMPMGIGYKIRGTSLQARLLTASRIE